MRPNPEFVISSPFLNLGCGQRFHPKWTNVDVSSTGPEVLSCDVRQGLPFPDGSFEVVYSSHTLEHIPPGEVDTVLKEIFRVLKPNGVLRLAVPDLEIIARTYLDCLDKALAGSAQWEKKYDWMVIELLDQLVREAPGGRMSEFVAKRQGDEAFIYERSGLRLESSSEVVPVSPRSLAEKIFVPASWWFARGRRVLRGLREKAIRLILGNREYAFLRLGRFRSSGEIHLWMYDRFSLPRLLQKHGFHNPTVVQAHQSAIPGWTGFQLDTNADGSVYKPDSLFIEATRPA